MRDPGTYRLYTIMGNKIAQMLGNAYINDRIEWMKVNFDFAISNNNKLCAVSREYDDLVVCFIDYDYDDTFVNNLDNLGEQTVDKLSMFNSEE